MSHSTPLKPPVSGFIQIGSEVSTGTHSVLCCYHHRCVRLAKHVLSWSCRSGLFDVRRVSLKEEADLYRCVHVMTLLQVIASSSHVHCKVHEHW